MFFRVAPHFLRCSLRYSFLCFWALAWILPYTLTRHAYPIPTFYPEFATLLLYLLMACLCACLGLAERRKVPLGMPSVAWIPAAFGVLLFGQILSLPLSQPSLNLLAMGFLGAAFIAMQTGFWAAQLGLAEKMMRWAAWALVAGGLFAVFCQLIQICQLEIYLAPWVLPYQEATERRLFGNMAQANHLSTYLSFALVAALFLRQTRRLPLLLWIIFSAVFVMGQAFTVSRMAWLQFVVIVLGGVVMGRLEKQRSQTQKGELAQAVSADTHLSQQTGQPIAKKNSQLNNSSLSGLLRPFLAPALLVIIFISINWAVRVANQLFQLQLADAATKRFHEMGQLSPRLALWRYGWEMFQAHPWLGVGWGEFPRYQYALLDKLGAVEIANNSHNILLDLLAKTGLVGVGLVLVGLACWLWRTTLARHAPRNATRVLGLTLLAVLAVHALLEYPQQYFFFLLPAAFLLGVLETRASGSNMVTHATTMLKTSYLALSVAGLAILYPIWRDYQRTETLYYGKYPQQQYRANPAKLFKTWGQYGLASLLPLDQKGLPEKLAMHEQALTLLPGQHMLQRYAVLLSLAGREVEALVVVRRLQLFSSALHNWPAQLANFYTLCDQQGKVLTPFKQRLVAQYGTVAQMSEDDGGA